MKHDYKYISENISIVPLSEEYSELYRQLRNRDDNRQWFKTDMMITADMQKAWYQGYLTKQTEYMFAIIDNSTKEFLGAVALCDINEEEKSAEIGRLIVDQKKSAGKGYASCALDAACIIGVQYLGLKKIYAEIYEDNIASRRSVQKLSFQEMERWKDEKGRGIVRVEKSWN